MRLANGTWVLILDGGKFLLLRNQGDADIMDLRVLGHDEISNPPTREQGAERPGRMPEVGPGRSTAAQTDWPTLEKERFAHDIADRLRSWALQRRFEALLVCADPRTLGAIRPHYHKEVAQRLVGEIDKDLTGKPVGQIEKTLGAL